jgi:hypothetical protein
MRGVDWPLQAEGNFHVYLWSTGLGNGRPCAGAEDPCPCSSMNRELPDGSAPGEEPLREAEFTLRLNVGVGHLDGPHHLQQFGVLLFDEGEDLFDEDAVFNHSVVVRRKRASFVGERVDVLLVDDNPIRAR